MASEHIRVKRKLRDIVSIKTFEDIINDLMISEQEKKLMYLYYVKKNDFCFIADTLGMSESSVKNLHRNVLKKISKIL